MRIVFLINAKTKLDHPTNHSYIKMCTFQSTTNKRNTNEQSKSIQVNPSQSKSIQALLIRTACLASASAFILVANGCSTAPSPTELSVIYRDSRADINATHAQLIAACDLLEGEAKTSCIQLANQWQRDQHRLANEGYNHALNGNWDAARERQKKLEEELLDMLPNFPQIKTILDITGVLNGSNSGQNQGQIMLREKTPHGVLISKPYPINIIPYSFSGNITIQRTADDNSAYTEPMSCSGNLYMDIDFDGLEATGIVKSGSLIALMPNGESVTLTVTKDSENIIITDLNGMGSIVFLANFEHSLDEWNAVLPDLQRVYLPVRITSAHSMIIDSNDSQLTTVAPFTPMIHSDYNADGTLDYITDFASFLGGYAQLENFADINHDLVWDQTDIDLWIEDFAFDVSHIQN